MAKRKRRRPMADQYLNPNSPLLQPLCTQLAHHLLAQAKHHGAAETVVMVMIPTSDGGADITSSFAWPLEQGAPSELMLVAMSHEIDCTRREIQ